MSSLTIPTESILTPLPASIALRKCRAKYIPDENGELRLAMVQSFSFPVFRENGLEEIRTKEAEHLFGAEGVEAIHDEYVRRASRRAKVNALDLILCNPELDMFATFTYRPEGNERTSYEDCYKKLGTWCSNAVQRRDLRYIAVPEHHADGEAIHFHMVCNHSAMKLRAARHNGRELTHKNGSSIYNITDWGHGWSTAVDINAGKADRDAVAKYIFKYMGKQSGQKIGGRYFLHGGKLRKPIYRLADDPSVFFEGEDPKYHRELEIIDGAKYAEWTFI